MLFAVVADVLTWIQTIANGGVLIAQLVQMGSMLYLMNQITNGAWIFKQARKFCIEFDQILVQYADKIYGYFVEIVGGTLITPEIIDGLMSRVYIIVGVFIFFKLMIVAIKYMVNPETFADDKVGANTLVKRVIIGSIIILFIPTIFSTAERLQKAIIGDRVIEKIILPADVYKEIIKTRNPGRDLAMLVFNGFFEWNDAIDSSQVKKVYNSYNKVKVYNDLTLFNKSYINEEKNDTYVINYIPIISTLATGYLLFMLVKYTLEVAFRSFKLMFLQVLSPFVIVNYMLDTSQEETMKKWLNSTISTYLIIFIRVMTLWLATLMAYYLKNGVSGDSVLNNPDPLLKSLIVLALFAFLKDLPKIISEIFGYNLQENETITGIMSTGVNVLKGFAMGKVAKNLARTQTISGMAASGLSSVGGLAGGAVQGQRESQKYGLGKKTTALNMISSGSAGAGGGISSVSSSAGAITSAYMGNTFMSPITQTASAASHSASADVRQLQVFDRNQFTGEDKQNNNTQAKSNNNEVTTINNNANINNTAQQKQELAQKEENSFIQELRNDPTIANYISGSNFNLNSSIENGLSTVNNPVIHKMSEKVYQDLGAPNGTSVRDIAVRMDNYLSSDDAKVNNPSYADVSELSSLMNDIKKEEVERLGIPTIINSAASNDARSDIIERIVETNAAPQSINNPSNAGQHVVNNAKPQNTIPKQDDEIETL